MNKEAISAAAQEIYHTSGRNRVMSYGEAQKNCESEARTILEVAEPHILSEFGDKLKAIRELHAEDLFRGHLSNGCRTCGHVGDIGYPCPTILALDA